MLMEQRIREAVSSCQGVLQIHGVYVNEERKTIRFDVVISFDVKNRKAAYEEIYGKVNGMYPEYELQIALDTDFSES
jgi:divalent metal cation (Fe/Co/Zn/Cd) transporter